MIRLDIFSDPVCPWCYIGKSLLERALESRPAHPFRIEWHPFQLNPQMPKGGAPLGDYIAARFGGRDKAVAMFAQVEEHAREAGVEIDFTRVARIPNTLDAHRLIHWAGLEGRQGAVVARLFRAYWREGQDIGDPEVLAGIGAGAGMDGAVLARLLASDADADDIAARDADARQKGVTAVPTFLIAQHYVVSGAQPVTLWQGVIDELLAQTAGAGVAPPHG